MSPHRKRQQARHCEVTRTTPGAYMFAATGDGGRSYNGDNASGLYLWRARLMAGGTSWRPSGRIP
jgi:hypothetical protein